MEEVPLPLIPENLSYGTYEEGVKKFGPLPPPWRFRLVGEASEYEDFALWGRRDGHDWFISLGGTVCKDSPLYITTDPIPHVVANIVALDGHQQEQFCEWIVFRAFVPNNREQIVIHLFEDVDRADIFYSCHDENIAADVVIQNNIDEDCWPEIRITNSRKPMVCSIRWWPKLKQILESLNDWWPELVEKKEKTVCLASEIPDPNKSSV